MTNINGSCLCGSVRYIATSKPLVTRTCWCKLCQTLASGNATINLAFAADNVTITGELKDYQSVADSGNNMHRRFCVNCGVHMFSTAEERPKLIIIRSGTLDDTSQLKVDHTIWTSTAPPWAIFDPNTQHFTHQPPAPKISC